MTMNDDNDGVHESVVPRPHRRRYRLAAGAASLAVVLGGGAYLLTSSLTGEHRTATDTGALPQVAPVAPIASESTPSMAPSATEPSLPPPATSARPTPAAASSPAHESSAAVRKAVEQARARASKDGIPLQRPPERTGMRAAGETVNTTEKTAEGSIQITTAHGDLTGQQDQLLAADDGVPVGDARCTQKLRFSVSAPARVMPTLLLCWRTSADRSVVTMAVATHGRPASSTSLAVIDREWAKLG